MKNDKDQEVGKDQETVISTQEGIRERSTLTGRPNIDVIIKRNEEESKQDRKSSYIVTGIVALLAMAIVFAIYFLAK